MAKEQAPNRLRPATFLCLLFVVAFLLRLAVVLWLRDISEGPPGPSSGDDYEFNVLAENVAAGQGYVNYQGRPTSFRAPGFPFLLAGMYFVTGPNYPLAYLLFCALGALSCVFTYLLAREVISEATARLAAWLSVFYLAHLYFSTIFLSENLFVPLLNLGLWLVIRYLKGGSVLLLALAGLVLGWTTLTRPFTLLLGPLLGVLLVWPPRSLASRLAAGVIWSVTFLGAVAPWTARNYFVHGEFVLLATNGGSTFYGGNNDRVVTEPKYFGYWLSTTDLPHRDLIDATPNEVAHDKMEWKLGIDWVQSHPEKFALAALFKIARLPVGLPDWDSGRLPYRILRMAGYWPFLVLMAVGGFVCLRRRLWSPPWLVLHFTILATVLTAVVFWGSPRFRDANVGVLMVYAAVGLRAATVRERLSDIPAS